jgi:ERF superfamily protein
MTTAPQQPAKPAGLHKKLSLAMSKIGRVPKRGRNQAQGYDYARADDVAEGAREALAELGVSILADVLESGVREIETKSGKARITWAKVAWTFTDSETGEKVTVHAPGEGMDSGDKGIYKAMTGSMKYVLMTNFLIPTGEGDPEADEPDDKPARGRQTNAQARAAVQQATQQHVPKDSAERLADVRKRLMALGFKEAPKRAEMVGAWLGRVADENLTLSADDWTRLDGYVGGLEEGRKILGKTDATEHDQRVN